MISKLNRKLSAQGFTIVELMIATSILAIILLMATVIMINVGDIYYKGVSEARAQDTVRSIADDVAQNLQLADQAPMFCPVSTCPTNSTNPTSPDAICIGETRYTYVMYDEIGVQSQSQYHVLWRDQAPSGTCTPVPGFNTSNLAASDPSGLELMTSSGRLTSFSVSLTSPYTVNVGIAYGSDSLLCVNGGSATNDCNNNASSTQLHPPPPNSQILCKGHASQQFCATANLSVTVSQRLTDD